MDSRVSARIPLEERQQGDKALSAIGASTTDLIRSAYDYLLETGSLPQVPHATALRNGKASPEQRERMRRILQATTCPVPADYFAGKSDDELLEEELRREYEALA